jgi:peptide/nickel transport system ATP-binding protein
MAEIVLQVQDVSISFRGEETITKALQHVSFSIEAGETLAIVGESGSGKSVCSLAIMGLLPKAAAVVENGKIFFCEKQNLLACSPEEMQSIRGNEIAMIFQEPMTSLNPLMTCGKQVAEAFIKHKKMNTADAKAKTIALFQEVKIPNPEQAYYKYPHEMSGGQKQRVMIAMALSCEPKLLIADEPTTALDVSVQQEILALLQELQQNRGTAIILITHDLAIVKNIAKQVLVMLKGECVEYGSATQIFQSPQHAYTKALINCRPSIAHRIKTLPIVADYLGLETENIFVNQIETEQQFNTRQLELSNQPIVLQVENVSIKYVSKKNIFGKALEYFTAVQDINIAIHKGETIGIVGESGCGKTTLGKAFVKLNSISAGKISYQGKDIYTEWNNSYHQKVQIIFQDPYSSLNPRKTIGEAIEEPMHVHSILQKKDRKKQVENLLQKVGLLPEHYDRYPHEFSGGQRQRVCIARALAMKAEVIICDESVSALDVSVQAQVLNLLSDLRAEFGLTILFISHDMNVIRHISDRIFVMQKGSIIEEANAYTLFANQQNEYTKRLIEAVPM